MIEIPRPVLKVDRVFRKLHQVIIENHKVAKHTENVILENKHIKDFCEEASHFAVMHGIFIHYDVSSWFNGKDGVIVRVERVCIYDDFMEYETSRTKSLHSSKISNIPNIN